MCEMCGKRGDRGSAVWYEGSERDLLLDPDETATEDGALLCDDCVRSLDAEDRPRWKPLRSGEPPR